MTTEVLVYISIGVELIVGTVLVLMVNSQNKIIDHYKTLLDSISPAKVKEMQDLFVAGLEAKYKAQAAAEVQQLTEQVFTARNAMDKEFAEGYNEMMGTHVFQIQKLAKPVREQAYRWFPTMGPTIKQHVEDLDKRLEQGQSR